MSITIGMKGIVAAVVEEADTALQMGSGSLRVLSTPEMIAMMEAAACGAIASELPEGKTSVGTYVCINHISATPVGMEMRTEATVTAVEGNTVTFDVKAYDAVGEIGNGTHKRAIVTAEKFLTRTYEKLK